MNKDITQAGLLLEVDLLRSQVCALEQANRQLRDEIQQLRADNRKLQDQIARLKRNSSNSSKPPSSDMVKPKTCRQQNRRVFEFFCNALSAHFRQEAAPSLLP